MSDSKITITSLMKMKQEGKKIVVLTSYDASFTRVLEDAGVDVVLIGDSLGMVIQGQESTLPVHVEDMVYHTKNVARARRRTLLVADMPFMSYSSAKQALETAGRLMKEGGAHMVKLEGGATQLKTVEQLADHGIPVCAHLGLLPQSVHKLGGYRVQGRDSESAAIMKEDALALQNAGAQMLVLECVPVGLAAGISAELTIPVIGIGAGVDCDGQVLVVYDMLGLSGEECLPRFVKNFMQTADSIQGAVTNYVEAVRAGNFPGDKQSFH